jgi:hypothetical protein
MDKFDFTSTCPSTFLKRKNKFAALLNGRDIHMIKEMVNPSSKTDNIPNSNENDIVLKSFDVK